MAVSLPVSMDVDLMAHAMVVVGVRGRNGAESNECCAQGKYDLLHRITLLRWGNGNLLPAQYVPHTSDQSRARCYPVCGTHPFRACQQKGRMREGVSTPPCSGRQIRHAAPLRDIPVACRTATRLPFDKNGARGLKPAGTSYTNRARKDGRPSNGRFRRVPAFDLASKSGGADPGGRRGNPPRADDDVLCKLSETDVVRPTRIQRGVRARCRGGDGLARRLDEHAA